MTSLFLQRKCEHPDRLTGSMKYSFDSVTLATSVVSISQFDFCPACSRFRPNCFCFTTKRASAAKHLGQIVAGKDITIFLSEPLVMGGQCKDCGQKVDVFDLACKFDENLAKCEACKQSSNSLRISDSVSLQELTAAFAQKPLPVKFVHFNHNDQQFMLELED